MRTLASDKLAIENGCYFDQSAADRVRFFFENFLRHSKGEWWGQKFTLLEWQWRDILEPAFGWKRRDGTRRFRKVYVEVPKKNGKSTMCAGVALYLLVGDDEPGAEVYTAAADRDQAAIVFDEAANMVEASPALQRRLRVRRSNKTIVYQNARSKLKALSSDAPTKEGLNIHGLVFDELHAQPNRVLWDTLKYGGRSRRQPLLFAITTAGFDRESLCWDIHQYALNELADGQDWEFLPYIAAAEPEADWTSPTTWAKANPSYGITVKEDALKSECVQAQRMPAEENSFKRYTLNIWTEQDVRAIQMAEWDGCKSEIDWTKYEGAECFAALDLSSTIDLTALVLAFYSERYKYVLKPYFWITERACKEREAKNKTRFDNWARNKHVTVCPGAVIDQGAIRSFINALPYGVQEIAVDRWNASQLIMQLDQDGFEVVPFGQGFASMSGPTKEFESLIISRRVEHDGHPVLRWCIQNLAFDEDDAGNKKPSKKKSFEKIDGAVASIMACALGMRRYESAYLEHGMQALGDEPQEQEDKGPSVYESRGVLVV